MNDKEAVTIIRDLVEERMNLLHAVRRKRSLTPGQRNDLADNHRSVAQALDRAIGALQYRINGKEQSER